MGVLVWGLAWIFGIGYLLYNRTSLQPFTALTGIGLILTTLAHPFSALTLLLGWLIYLGIFVTLNITDIRQKYITKHLYTLAANAAPNMSYTEKVALEAGHTWWEGELFRGKPDWDLLINYPKPVLSQEEQDFLNGPVETLCAMANKFTDFRLTHEIVDLPPEIWQFIKDNGFLGIIIPKQFGGLEFSAVAHTAIVTKLASCSITLCTSVAVPNSLGPAELLLHYGTEEQKNYYLPRLAQGQEIPCFALTGPEAGSDATSIPDIGIVCHGVYDGKEIIGIQLNFNKRYITLAPIATIIGLAFKLYDPDNLLGENIIDRGITCALIPRNTDGIIIGDRHFPLNTAFQNGPIVGHDVFIPLDFIIGGVEMAGNGWRMLMECLSVGRAISLPSTSSGGQNLGVLTTGAYSRIRQQFHTPICGFEGIQEPLARMVALNYISNAARLETAAAIDNGIKPSVASSIVKMHTTEFGRQVALDTMDIHGGKGICLGPNNYIGRCYQASPIAITVEGANILTRSMMIFGQGSIRCHPYALEEMQAINNKDLEYFDTLIYRHAGYLLSNAVRSLWLSLTMSRFSFSPKTDATKKYYQWINKFSANLAFAADFSMIIMGGELKRKEGISARLGDVLSNLYLMSTVLKYYNDNGSPPEDLIIVNWSCKFLAYRTQEALNEIAHNFPNKLCGRIIKLITLPMGNWHKIPSDRLNKELTKLVSQPSSTRARIKEYVSNSDHENNFVVLLENVMVKTIAAEPIAKRLNKAVKDKKIDAVLYTDQIQEAVNKNIITNSESEILLTNRQDILKIINVDQFKTEELVSLSSTFSGNKSHDKLKKHTNFIAS
jgi:acyl-CoA dehydrogenase